MPSPRTARVPLVFGQEQYPGSPARSGSRTNRRYVLPGRSTSIDIWSQGVQYEQEEQLPITAQRITYIVRIDIAEHLHDWTGGPTYRTVVVTRDVGTKARQVYEDIKRQIEIVVRRRGNTNPNQGRSR